MADEELLNDSKPPKNFKEQAATVAIRVWKICKASALVLFMILGIIIAIIMGAILRAVKDTPYTERQVMYADFLGELFIRMLRVITIPLFMCSVISALGSLNMREFGVIGLRTLVYFTSTSSLSAVLGLILVLLMRPGQGHLSKEQEEMEAATSLGPSIVVDSVLDFLRNVIPYNFIDAALVTDERFVHGEWIRPTSHIRAARKKLRLQPPSFLVASQPQFEIILEEKTVLIVPSDTSMPMELWDFKLKAKDETNYMGLVTISLLFGIVMGYKGPKVASLLRVFSTINEIFIKLTFLVILVSPIPVFSLTLAQVLRITDWAETMQQMGLYVACNMIGLFIITFIINPTIYIIVIRKSPLLYFYNTLEALATACVTASSIATLPVTLKCLELKNHMDKRITRFVAPLGATVNMNGAALYIVIGPIFVAQLHKLPISVGQYIGVCLMSALASVGAAGIPQGPAITMVMILNLLNVPPQALGIILSLDWFIDRFETAVNVFGDCVGCAVVQHLSRKQLSAGTAEPEIKEE